MVMDARQLGRVTATLVAQYRAERPRLERIAAYMANRADDIYVPRSATSEYRRLVDQARFNVLPLVVNGLAQNLYVDGYRSSTPAGRAITNSNVPIWDEVWQPNRMDARQAALYRGAITYGYSYALVLPGSMSGRDTAVITPYSPRHLTALYDDPINDEWPRYAMVCPKPLDGAPKPYGDPLADPAAVDGIRVTVYDDEARYHLIRRNGAWAIIGDAESHDLGVCPVVRYLDSFGDDEVPAGKVEPLLPAQRQLNQTTFGLLMAQQYAAFRQRWVTGMAVPVDEKGVPYEPWNAAVNRVWQAESPDTRFGEFGETNLDGYLNSRDKTLSYISSVAQVPPHNLIVGAGISNISAEALAALEASRRQDIFEHQNTFGESVEQTMRLSGLAMGNREAWNDLSAQAMWRDTTPRSMAQIADALGKLAQTLEVPPRALWERIPGVTDQDLARWESMADANDMASLLAEEVAGAEPGGEAADDGAAAPSTAAI